LEATRLRYATRSRFRNPDRVQAALRCRPPASPDQGRTWVTLCVRGVISPLLANLYLHYLLDRWGQAWRQKVAHGDVIVVRYADDVVLGFQHREDADRFLADLQERVRKFGLELHPEKTRLIEFGRYAAERRAKRGAGKPETFNFLGFTHICGKNHTTGCFLVLRKTIGKRMAAKLKKIRQQLRQRLHARVADTTGWLQSVVRGYFRATRSACTRSGTKCCACGGDSFDGGVKEPAGTETNFGSGSGASSRTSKLCIRILTFALRGNTSKVRTVCVRSARTDLCAAPASAAPRYDEQSVPRSYVHLRPQHHNSRWPQRCR